MDLNIGNPTPPLDMTRNKLVDSSLIAFGGMSKVSIRARASRPHVS